MVNTDNGEPAAAAGSTAAGAGAEGPKEGPKRAAPAAFEAPAFDIGLLGDDAKAKIQEYAARDPCAKGKKGMTVAEMREECLLRGLPGITVKTQKKAPVWTDLVLKLLMAQDGSAQPSRPQHPRSRPPHPW